MHMPPVPTKSAAHRTWNNRLPGTTLVPNVSRFNSFRHEMDLHVVEFLNARCENFMIHLRPCGLEACFSVPDALIFSRCHACSAA